MNRPKKERPSYEEQIQRAIKRAARRGDYAAMQYYSERFGTTSACVTFERFRNSWAGQRWMQKRGFVKEDKT